MSSWYNNVLIAQIWQILMVKMTAQKTHVAFSEIELGIPCVLA